MVGVRVPFRLTDAAASLVLNNGLYVIDDMPASCEEDGLSSGLHNIFSFPGQAEFTSKYFSLLVCFNTDS
jgi:hypothetical protein